MLTLSVIIDCHFRAALDLMTLVLGVYAVLCLDLLPWMGGSTDMGFKFHQVMSGPKIYKLGDFKQLLSDLKFKKNPKNQHFIQFIKQ